MQISSIQPCRTIYKTERAKHLSTYPPRMHTIFKTLNLAYLSAQMTAKLPILEDSPPRQILVEACLRQKRRKQNTSYRITPAPRKSSLRLQLPSVSISESVSLLPPRFNSSCSWLPDSTLNLPPVTSSDRSR